MKKTLLALAVLGCTSGFAMAESSVQLYGLLDGGVVVSKHKDASTKVQAESGFRSGSRWGLRGSEDLGNSNRVFFQLEQGFNLDSGETSGSGSFTREAQLGISGDWGTVGFGRFGSLSSGTGSYSLLDGTAFGTSYGLMSADETFNAVPRLNNAIVYVTPDMAGFKASAMYSNGIVNDDGRKFGDNTKYFGVGLRFDEGPFGASFIWDAVDWGDTLKTADGKTPDMQNNFTLGGSWDMGFMTLYGAYQFTKSGMVLPGGYGAPGAFGTDNKMMSWTTTEGTLSSKKGFDSNAFSLSVAAPLGGGTAKLGAQYLMGKFKGDTTSFDEAGLDKKFERWTVGAAYEYPLSKRTLVYAFGGYSDGKKLMNTAKAADGSSNARSDYNYYQVAVGLQHTF